jgi:hypothetical protein
MKFGPVMKFGRGKTLELLCMVMGGREDCDP